MKNDSCIDSLQFIRTFTPPGISQDLQDLLASLLASVIKYLSIIKLIFSNSVGLFVLLD